MIIGYSVEGSTDRAVVVGLRDLWCPNAELVEGSFRGLAVQSRRREYKKMCEEFALKGVDAIVILADGDGDNWQAVNQNERDYLPEERFAQLIFGVPDRNIECWICADAHWIGQQLDTDADRFTVEDPKSAFERAAGITRDDRREHFISGLVRRAPLRRWLGKPSFEDFYEQARDLSQTLGCEIENLRDAER